MLRFGRYDYAAFWSFFCYAGCSLSIPVALVTMARALGFPLESGGMGAGGMLQVVRSASMVAAMLGCGFAAGRFGKRRTLGWAVALMGSGVVLCALANSYLPLLLALLAAGLGGGVLEGIGTPFVETLHRREPGRYVNIAHSFWSVGIFCCVLGVGALLAWGVSWRIVVAGSGLLCVIPVWLLLNERGVRRRYPEEASGLSYADVVRRSAAIARSPHFWWFFFIMFLAGGVEFGLTFWVASFIQLDFSAGAWAGGVGTAMLAAGMFCGRYGSGVLVRQHRLRRLVVGCALAGLPVTVAMLLVGPGMLGVLFALLFLAGICVGPFWPAIQVYCTDRLPQLDSTLIYIYLSCAGIPGCGFFTWLMGAIADRWSLRAAFLLEPLTLALLAAALVAEGSSRREDETAAV